jgi:hypothetical protein
MNQVSNDLDKGLIIEHCPFAKWWFLCRRSPPSRPECFKSVGLDPHEFCKIYFAVLESVQDVFSQIALENGDLHPIEINIHFEKRDFSKVYAITF